MGAKRGSLSIDSENIFPIIKKWMYSDQDIFYRELISNASDAITKLKKLDMMGEYELPAEYKAKIEVIVNPEDKTIKVIDNGLGMTADEVEEYINRIAFSGATDFLEKYKDKANDDQIIGHFGLGFYSVFMVADRVHIDTLSYKNGAQAVHWECDGGTEFAMEDGARTQVGTEITLFLSEDCLKYCNEYEARSVLKKYCSFMPVEIYLSKANTTETETILKSEVKDTDEVVEEVKQEKKDDPEKVKIKRRPELLNETKPLWTRNANDCTKEEYLEFYRKVFNDYKEPLFWIHLNMDYPFNLKGILYFPKINMEYESIEGTIKLYNNQVFVADNIKEVIPEFLLLLKGVIDCPDLPLNVSRSFLQNDGYVKKLSAHITKKVADKLNGLFNTERKQYETYWDDIHPFVKYGCVRDQKFYDMVKGSLLLKTTAGEYLTLDEYKSRNEGKAEKKVYYTTEANRQAAAVALYTEKGIDVAVMDTLIDMNFMSFMEFGGGNEGLQFVRVDADVSSLTEESEEGKDIDQAQMEKLFRDALGDQELTVKIEALSDHTLPVVLTEEEQVRRYKEMSAMYGQDFGFPSKYTLVLNRLCPTIRSLAAMEEGDVTTLLCKQLFDLARLSSRPLEAADLKNFIARSNELVAQLAEKG